MTDPTMSRRRMLRATLGAAVGIMALDRVASALPDGITRSAGVFGADELQPAERIPTTVPPTTTPPTTPPTTTPTTSTTLVPPPAGMIAFPIDAQPDCWISDNFGDCRGSNCSRAHAGLDIMGSRDANLFAVVTGRLTKKYDATPGRTYGAGNGWTLYDEENDVVYKYFHMATHTDGLAEGDIVQFGDVIGTVGNTGTSGANSDTNYHLHFEYRPGNVPQDPRPLLVRPDNCTFTGG